tara:strand:- start:287 stop:406 length:120 start_codon:yes stop_codon:yes gene_type:complete
MCDLSYLGSPPLKKPVTHVPPDINDVFKINLYEIGDLLE